MVIISIVTQLQDDDDNDDDDINDDKNNKDHGPLATGQTDHATTYEE